MQTIVLQMAFCITLSPLVSVFCGYVNYVPLKGAVIAHINALSTALEGQRRNKR